MMNSSVMTTREHPAPINGVTVNGIHYTISGGDLPVVRFELNEGQVVIAEKGGMNVMSAGIDTTITNLAKNASTLGKIGKAIKRSFSGESLFLQEHTAKEDNQHITMRTTLPGEIVAINLGEGDEVIMQRGAFLCAEEGVDFDLEIQTNIAGGFLGGEGFLMQRAKGPGTVFVSMGGNGAMYELGKDEKLIVSTGAVGAYDPSVRLGVERVRGIKNIAFGGEGIANTTLTGPGRVWIQSMPARDLAMTLQPYLLNPGKDEIGNAANMVGHLPGLIGKVAEIAVGA